MKKNVTITLAIVAVLAISAFLGKNTLIDWIAPQAKGVILYGEQQQVNSAVNKHRVALVNSEIYPIKTSEADGQKVMYLSQTTIHALIKQELLKEVKSDDITTVPVTSLPPIPNGEGLLFAKQPADKIKGTSHSLSVKYEKNLIIGNGRAYVDAFVVLDDSQWLLLEETEKTMAVMEFKKNPEKLIGKFGAEREQLVRMS